MEPNPLLPVPNDSRQDVSIPLSERLPQSDDISLAELWRILLKRRWIVLLCMTACMSVAIAYFLLVSPRYTATARIAIDPDQSDALNLEDIGATVAGGANAQTRLETEVQVLQSETLALEVINRLGLANNPLFLKPQQIRDIHDPSTRSAVLKAWQSSLNVKSVPKTNLIQVSFRSKSPELSSKAINTLLDSFVERNFRVKFESTMQASDWLSKQLSDIKAKTQEAEQELADYQKKSGILVWGENNSSSLVTSQMEELNKALTAAQADRILKEARYRVAQYGNPEMLASVAPGSSLQVLRAQQVDLNNQYAQANAKYGSAYPRVRQLKSQVEQVDSAIKVEVKNLKERLKDEYASAKRAEDMLAGQMEGRKQEAYKLNEGAVQLQILQREAQSNRELYEGLLKKLKEAGVVAGLRSTNINIVDYAQVPSEPSDPKLPWVLGFGLAGGAFLGLAGVFIVENLDNAISSIDEAEVVSGLPSLAAIPLMSSRKMRRFRRSQTSAVAAGEQIDDIALTHPKSHATEAFRALRTSIMLSRWNVPPKTIVVTSTFPEEGKSTTSLNTAIVFAQEGASVLLIDADMRRSTLHRKLGLQPRGGLSGVLTGAVPVEQCILRLDKLPGLAVLPGGVMPPYPAELLGSPAMKSLIQRCAKEFDFIIIDTPPALTVTDAVIMAAQADATVLVMRSGQTGRHALRRTRDILSRAGAKLAGVVINAVDFNSPDNYYYYSYGSSKYANYYHKYYEDPQLSDEGSLL